MVESSVTPDDCVKGWYDPAMEWRERIEWNPKILSGEPVIRGTRVLVRALVGGLAGGMTIEQVCMSYRVDGDDVRAALRCAVEVLAEQRGLGASNPR